MIPKLRDYQTYCVDECHKLIDIGQNPCVVVPTGGGKSLIIGQLAHDYTQQGKKVAIMVHRKELLSQLSIALCRYNITHNIIAPPAVARQIITIQRKEFSKQFYHHSSNIGIISVDTLNSRARLYEQWIKNVDYVMIDEAAHVLKTNKWGRAISLFVKAVKIGFTATPERLDKKGLGSWNDGMFDKIVQGPKVKELIERGYLCKYQIVAPRSDFEEYLGHVKLSTSDYSHDVIATAANKSRIVGDVVTNYQKFANGTQAIVFAPTLEVGEKMEKQFIEAGIPAKFISSLSGDLERFNAVNDFKFNKINVLLNVDLLDEGFDVPIAEGKKIVETVILARPTMSLGKCLQQIGRGLRPSPNKKIAVFIDHVGNVKRHGLPCANRNWSLDRPGKRKKSSRVRTCHNCLSVYDRVEVKCPYCGAGPVVESAKGRVPPEMCDGDLVLIDPETLAQMEFKTKLEDPLKIAERVTHVAGIPAGKKAYKTQVERINVQADLKDLIAVWAGKQHALGLDDRQIHKQFYLDYEMTINQALSVPKLQMNEIINDIKNDLGIAIEGDAK